jgi:hypothetical protein
MRGGFVIVRASDFRAVMDGTNACSVRWGFDPERVRVYDTWSQAQASLRLLADTEDEAYVAHADIWALTTASARVVQ